MAKLSKDLTISRLELTAILFGSRLAKCLKDLRLSQYHTTFVWSDVKSALFRVRSQTSNSTYVLNRAKEVKELVQDYDLLLVHVGTKGNPADPASKGTNVSGLIGKPYNAFRILLKVVKAKASTTVKAKVDQNPNQVMLRLAQVNSFPWIYNRLQGRTTHLTPDDKNLIYQTCLNLDDQGLIRCQPPHTITPTKYDRLPPLLLHPKCPLWTHIRQTIKSLIRQCLHCRRMQTPPLKFLPPARLHPNRIHFRAPFSTTGVDFTGTFKLKQSHVDVAYVVVFTCTIIQALVLEVVTSLSVADFFRALRRFAARVGMSLSFILDNAANFGAADWFLRELKDQPDTKEFFTHRYSIWIFITPLAPWHGGVYERHIGITKSNLRKALFKRIPTYDEFRTLCQEVECVVNNLPLTYVGTEDDIPLTPNHLMHDRTIALSPQIKLIYLDAPDYLVAITRKAQYQYLTDFASPETNIHWLASFKFFPPLITSSDPSESALPRENMNTVTRIIPLELNLNTDTSPPPSPTDNPEPLEESPPSEEVVELDTVDKETTLAAIYPT
ncbi:uncharacterized protein LOC143027385 [Oratosquilla oratoria]|uniref:uncharacterized protein LOC143027385 n=1 Tax=Oratosquilla oratoria TaxID=337810 RepID=UPI003F7723F5